MVIMIQDGKIVGCERDGHSLIHCSDCIVEDAAECHVLEQKLVEKPKQNARLPSRYEEIAQQVAILVEKKQYQYGDSFGNADKILKILYPHGISVDQYQDLLTIVRIVDKLFRIARGDQGEESAWQDINGYSLLALAMSENNV